VWRRRGGEGRNEEGKKSRGGEELRGDKGGEGRGGKQRKRKLDRKESEKIRGGQRK
jgi:hypothetical protein